MKLQRVNRGRRGTRTVIVSLFSHFFGRCVSCVIKVLICGVGVSCDLLGCRLHGVVVQWVWALHVRVARVFAVPLVIQSGNPLHVVTDVPWVERYLCVRTSIDEAGFPCDAHSKNFFTALHMVPKLSKIHGVDVDICFTQQFDGTCAPVARTTT